MPGSTDHYTLYGAPGSGATVVHAALTLIGARCTPIDVAPWEGEVERNKLTAINPMRQVPVLVMPSGEVMTESAAILLWLGDRYPEAGLCPAPADALRAQYLRWMVYIPAAIYAMYWVRDDPARLVPDVSAQGAMLSRSADRIAECWRMMDAQMPHGTAYLLGDRISMLDLYVAVASRWTPRRPRFCREAPRLAEVVRRVDRDARLQAFWDARFPLSDEELAS